MKRVKTGCLRLHFVAASDTTDVCLKAEIITGDSQIQFSVTTMVKALSVKLINWHMAHGVLMGQHDAHLITTPDIRCTIDTFFRSWKLVPRSITTCGAQKKSVVEWIHTGSACDL